MSTSDELLRLLDVTVVAEDQDLIQRAADELDALQAKLDAVRALCRDYDEQSDIFTLAVKVLSVIDKETNDGR